MTELTKPVRRETAATQFEKSQLRNVIVSVEPAGRDQASVGFRLKGTRQTYRIGVNQGYLAAVQHHLAKIEKLAKKLMKEEGLSIRSARAKARKEKAKDLR